MLLVLWKFWHEVYFNSCNSGASLLFACMFIIAILPLFLWEDSNTLNLISLIRFSAVLILSAFLESISISGAFLYPWICSFKSTDLHLLLFFYKERSNEETTKANIFLSILYNKHFVFANASLSTSTESYVWELNLSTPNISGLFTITFYIFLSYLWLFIKQNF